MPVVYPKIKLKANINRRQKWFKEEYQDEQEQTLLVGSLRGIWSYYLLPFPSARHSLTYTTNVPFPHQDKIKRKLWN